MNPRTGKGIGIEEDADGESAATGTRKLMERATR
jgi:hypothetical protein